MNIGYAGTFGLYQSMVLIVPVGAGDTQFAAVLMNGRLSNRLHAQAVPSDFASLRPPLECFFLERLGFIGDGVN